jgi:RNA recognition motif-containing protein
VRGCTLAIIFTAVTEQVLPALMGEQDEEYEAFVAELSGGKPASAGPSAPPPLDETCLHVGALPADFTEVALSAMFSTYGKIVHHKVGLADRHNPAASRLHGHSAAAIARSAVPIQNCAQRSTAQHSTVSDWRALRCAVLRVLCCYCTVLNGTVLY